MSPTIARSITALASLAAVVLAACGEDVALGGGDATPTPVDAAAVDAQVDAPADAEVDAEVDAPVDATLDAPVDAAATFVVTAVVSDPSAGTVTSTPAGIDCGATCSATFPVGASVVLTAAPAAGQVFTGWSGACSGAGPCVVAGAATVVASFAPDALVVTRSGSGSGRVASAPAGIDCGLDCDERFPVGTTVALTAVPDPGSVFAGWVGGGCAGTGACVITYGGAVVVTATFTLATYKLTIIRDGTGTGFVVSVPSGISCGGVCSAQFPYGQFVVLTAVPASSSAFTGWTGGTCPGTGTCTLAVTGPITIVATFTQP